MPPARSAAAARSAARAAARSSTGRAAPSRPRPARERVRLSAGRIPGPAPRLRLRWERIGRYGLVVVLTIVVGLYVEHALSYLSTRSQANAQSAVVRSLERQNAALRREAGSLNDPTTIVRDARALGMVRPGERPYVVQNP
jgi:cell division protein FtsB